MLRIVPQDGRPRCFEDHYAPRIYLKGEIQTRTENWHDFFQFLTWFLFPGTKAQINAMHLPLARGRAANGGDSGHRKPMENMLSLFDEGGAVVVSSDGTLLDLIREFQWKRLFWERREDVKRKLHCIVFGHAVYEKGLLPYVGMTANCMLLSVDDSFHRKSWPSRLAHLDERLKALLEERTQYVCPRDLSPFPLLGLPRWGPDNEAEVFYDNPDYFRAGRRKRPLDSRAG